MEYKLRFGVTIASFTVSNTLLAIIPIFIGRLVGALSARPINGHEAVVYVWILIICSSGHNMLWRCSEVLYMKLLAPLNFIYEGRLFQLVIHKPYPYFVDKFTGKIASYINTISDEQRGFFTELCYNYIGEIVSLLIMLGILLSVNWQTGAIFFGGVTGMFIVGRYTIRNSTIYEKRFADVMSTKNARIIDAVANFVNVKSFRKETIEIATINKQENETITAIQKTQFWGIVFWGSMSVFVRDIMWPATIALNVYLFLHHSLTLAQLSVILSTLLIFSSTVWEAIWNLSQLNLRLARAEEAHRYLLGEHNMVDLYREHSEPKTNTPAFKHSLAVTDLTFAYPDKPDSPVLRSLNLRIQQGQKIGLVGRSGSGKSTLTKLLLGY